VSADDFRDLLEEFRNDAECALRFFHVTAGAVRNGVPGAPTLVEFYLSDGYVWVPRAPKAAVSQLPPDKRERDTGLVWGVNPNTALNVADVVGHTTCDRVYDADTAKWYSCEIAWRYGRQAQVNGAVCVLIDRDLGDPPEEEPEPDPEPEPEDP
jgi:hypothetical protein